MNKKLVEVDLVYESIIQHMTIKDRINYCVNLVSKTESFLKSTEKDLDKPALKKYSEIIHAAKAELKDLGKSVV